MHADNPMRGARHREAAAAAVRAVTAADIRDRVRRAAMRAGAGPLQAPGVVAAVGIPETAVDVAVITDGGPRTDRT